MYTRGRIGQALPVRQLRRPRYASRGQALILAVLIMFLLVGLGGLFIAMISHALVQTARAAERDKLESIALAGLSMATSQLLTSPHGADWRPDDLGPDENNPGWIHFGEGFYKITVRYGPQDSPTEEQEFLTNPLERFLKIDVEARYALTNPPRFDEANPEFAAYRQGYLNGKRYLTRKISALAPIGITDHLLWVTNLDGSPEPVILGSALTITDDYPGGAQRLTTVNTNPTAGADLTAPQLFTALTNISYRPIYDGPIRIDSDVTLGNIDVFLTDDDSLGNTAAKYLTNFSVRRFDQFLVTGKVAQLAQQTAVTPLLAVNGQSTSLAGPLIDPLLEKASVTRMGFFQTRENNPLIRPLEPPRLDQRDRVTGVDRYRTLTRDSGHYDTNAGVFTGAVAQMSQDTQGRYEARYEGLYIHNPNQVQFPGDPDALFAEWLAADDPAAESSWRNGIYDPVENGKAVELVLHDWEIDKESKLIPPYIELRSTDAVLYDMEGKLTTQTTRPYPRNGVIFAEGNLVVKGTLPASVIYENTGAGYQSTGKAGGTNPRTGGVQYFVEASETKYNRRFDLTIVSGGTIYIEGNLQGPASRSERYALNDPNRIKPGEPRDSKLALLAMDNVCLNPTKRYEVMRSADTEGMNADLLHARPGSPSGASSDGIQLRFAMAGSPDAAVILLRHGGQLIADDSYCTMSMALNGRHHPWEPFTASSVQHQFLFCTEQVATTPLWTSFTPSQKATFMFPGQLGQTIVSNLTSGWLNGFGAWNTVEFNVENGNTDYLLSPGDETFGPGFAVTGMDIQVDALIYAQRGSWFVIPGRYFNNDAPDKGIWALNRDYEKGDKVLAQASNGSQIVYRCVYDHTSDAASQPGEGSNWAEKWTLNTPWPFPQYHEPLDVQIIVNGAIVQNRPAPLTAEEESLKRWRGSNLRYYASGGNTVPDLLDPKNPIAGWDPAARRWTNRRMGIEYHYDATLARPVCYSVETVNGVTSYHYSPRLPKLPVSPTLFSFGAMRGA